MKRYKEYQTISLPWLNNIPANWTMHRNKVFLHESKDVVGNKSKDYTLLSLTLNGIIPRDVSSGKGKFPSDFGTYKIIRPNDIVFCLFDVDETPRTVGLSNLNGMLTGAYDVFHVSGINSRYLLYYYLCLDDVKALRPLYKGLRKTINIDTFLGTRMPVPPSAEQDQIVRYLDWQVSKINRLIAAKRKQIALLHEQHKRRISEAVLHGNDDGCCQKDSGVEWIGMIPEHWSVIRCKYVFTERDERSIAGEEEHLSMSQKYGLVPDSKLDERRMLSESYVGGKVCYKNDLVLNRLKAHLGVFALSPQKGVISPDYTVLIPNAERILPTYGEAVLKNDLCRRELRIRVRGIIEGFWRLYTDDFNTIVIPLPPLKEQEQIMKHLSALNNKFTALKQRLEQEINILHELRTRLISDVVTGQIDVRGIKVPDDEYTYTETLEEETEEETEEE